MSFVAAIFELFCKSAHNLYIVRMDENSTMETVVWFVRAVKEEVVEESKEKTFESRENAADEFEIVDTKSELPFY
jgi:hypothetical protein